MQSKTLRPDILLLKTKQINNALVKVEINQTLYLDDDENMWECDKPDNVREVLRRSTTHKT